MFELAVVVFGILHCGSTGSETAEIPKFTFTFLVFIWGKFLPILVGSYCLFSLICCPQHELRLLQNTTSVTISKLICRQFPNFSSIFVRIVNVILVLAECLSISSVSNTDNSQSHTIIIIFIVQKHGTVSKLTGSRRHFCSRAAVS